MKVNQYWRDPFFTSMNMGGFWYPAGNESKLPPEEVWKIIDSNVPAGICEDALPETDTAKAPEQLENSGVFRMLFFLEKSLCVLKKCKDFRN